MKHTFGNVYNDSGALLTGATFESLEHDTLGIASADSAGALLAYYFGRGHRAVRCASGQATRAPGHSLEEFAAPLVGGVGTHGRARPNRWPLMPIDAASSHLGSWQLHSPRATNFWLW